MAISDHGKREALNRKAETVKKINTAMETIEVEMDRHHGIYPYNQGRLSQQEVLRRAGLNSTLLQKETHQELHRQVSQWIRRVQKKSIQGASSVRSAVTDRVDEAKSELTELRQRWSEAELKYIDAQETIANQKSRIAELEKQLERLEKQFERSQDRAIIPIRRKK